MFRKEIFVLVNYKTGKMEGYATTRVDYNIFRASKAKAIDKAVDTILDTVKKNLDDKIVITNIKAID